MKSVYKLTALTLMMFAVSASGFCATKAENLVRGVVGPVGSNASWSGYSVLNQIPGGGLIPLTSANTVFYLGFTAGTQADISNMVLYTTARGSTTITAVTPVKLGGISNPSINVASPTVCPTIISASNPCIVRLDPTVIALSALNDYYLVVYFTANDNNNGSIGATQPRFGLSDLTGWFIRQDETGLMVGQSIPAGQTGGPPFFLMYVMTN